MSGPGSKLERAVQLGVQLFGSGAGAYLGALTGDPTAAAVTAMAGTTFAEVGSDIVARVMSPRQTARVGAVFFVAGAEIKALEVMGHRVRTDGFWAGEHSTGSEFAEGVMLAAMDSFEERKLPYLAKLLANVATHDEIDGTTANYSIRVAEGLSWLELCLLGVLARPNDFPLPDGSLGKATDWYGGTVHRAWVDLSDAHHLIHSPRAFTIPSRIATFDNRLSRTEESPQGLLVTKLMDLGTIPAEDLRPVWEALVADPGPVTESTPADVNRNSG